jgi:8-amino-7-oxononanoate synthase
VRYIRNNPYIGKILLEKAAKFRGALNFYGWDCMSCSTQIVPVLTGSAESALELSSFLKSNNVRVPAIRIPTVPKGKERIRFSIHLGISDEDMELVCQFMGRYKKAAV